MQRVAIVLVVFLAALAEAQQIHWVSNPQTAVAQAKARQVPLMVYSQRDLDCTRAERRERDVFRDAEVARLASNFISLSIAPYAYRDVQRSMGLGEHPPKVAFLSPTGELLGASNGGTSEALAQQMRAALAAYGRQIFERDVAPVLAAIEIKPKETLAALARAKTLNVPGTDALVLRLVERSSVPDKVRKEAYGVLAQTATGPAIEKLYKLAKSDDKDARAALLKAPAPAAEHLLKKLDTGGAGSDYLAYEAVAKICDVPKVKPEKFFDKAKPEQRTAEIERVKKSAATAIERYRATAG